MSNPFPGTLGDRTARRRAACRGAETPPLLSLSSSSRRRPRRWRPSSGPASAAETLQPRFVSVTYGAGGSTQARTHATVLRLVKETALIPAAHLTCVGASAEEVDEVARQYWDAGVRHIVALRGDPPPGASLCAASGRLCLRGGSGGRAEARRGFRDLRRRLSGNPPAGAQPDGDLDNLKRKLDAGATRAITQFFFDTGVYLRFLDRCLAAGITAPIVPGIMPVSNFAQAAQFSASCGTAMPDWLGRTVRGLDDDLETRRMVAAVVAAEQVRLLQANGVDEFHFYTLNRARPDLRHRPDPRRAAQPAEVAAKPGTPAADEPTISPG